MLGLQARALASVNDWDGLDRWAEAMVSGVDEQGARGGCSIGTLAAALSDSDERLRRHLSEGFTAWRDAIRGALSRLRDNGFISADADLDALTTSTLASIQGVCCWPRPRVTPNSFGLHSAARSRSSESVPQ